MHFLTKRKKSFFLKHSSNLVCSLFLIPISEGSISEVLNKLTVRVVSNEDCKKSYGPIIHNSTLCAIGIERGTGTCQVRFENLSHSKESKILSYL